MKFGNSLMKQPGKKVDNWAGKGYTFYEDNNGIKRCVTQVYGSGVYVVTPLAYLKVEIKNDTILLMVNIAAAPNHYDYQTMETLVSKGDRLYSADEKFNFILFSKTPLVYDFHTPSSGKKIPLEELKKFKE